MSTRYRRQNDRAPFSRIAANVRRREKFCQAPNYQARVVRRNSHYTLVLHTGKPREAYAANTAALLRRLQSMPTPLPAFTTN